MTVLGFLLKRILYRKAISSEDLLYFDTNGAVRQCAVSGTIGSCQMLMIWLNINCIDVRVNGVLKNLLVLIFMPPEALQ